MICHRLWIVVKVGFVARECESDNDPIRRIPHVLWDKHPSLPTLRRNMGTSGSFSLLFVLCIKQLDKGSTQLNGGCRGQ